ncbi:hypothetical protein FHETE_8029 [Fusarium heterosporum]|uniref:Uncharacterized protein n=1 Tax=Fusarium heterosporum TaxID=42747 RepID=A0A8H5T327_FUSHE|nr:hypothetical protein FHETE_8029 [Fusarium heterosporum]
MTGKPVYKPEEIRFALNLMVQDLFNEEISQSFRSRFNRELTDNQIRYLRNKYGKDPDYGSPLVNRPANKKLKRRREAMAAGSLASTPSEVSRPIKQIRRERSTTLPRSSFIPRNPPGACSRAPTLKAEVKKSPSLFSTPLPSAAPAQSKLSNVQSSIENFYTSNTTGFSPNAWHTQPGTTFTTNFTPINTQFGQYDTKSPSQGSHEANTTLPDQTSLSASYIQPPYSTYSIEKPAHGSQIHNMMPTPNPQQAPSTSFPLDMSLSNYSQLSNPAHPQQVVPPQECSPVQKSEPVACEGDIASLSWEEYVRPARSAAERNSSHSLLTQSIEAPDDQLQLEQKQSASCPTSRDGDDRQKTVQEPPHSVPKNQQSNAHVDSNAIDPRLFGSNYDPRFFVKKSPS